MKRVPPVTLCAETALSRTAFGKKGQFENVGRAFEVNKTVRFSFRMCTHSRVLKPTPETFIKLLSQHSCYFSLKTIGAPLFQWAIIFKYILVQSEDHKRK